MGSMWFSPEHCLYNFQILYPSSWIGACLGSITTFQGPHLTLRPSHSTNPLWVLTLPFPTLSADIGITPKLDLPNKIFFLGHLHTDLFQSTLYIMFPCDDQVPVPSHVHRILVFKKSKHSWFWVHTHIITSNSPAHTHMPMWPNTPQYIPIFMPAHIHLLRKAIRDKRRGRKRNLFTRNLQEEDMAFKMASLLA